MHGGPLLEILAEGEGEGLHTGIEEFDFERAVFDCAFLTDELVETMALDCASSAGVGVAAVVITWSGAVKCDFKADGLAIFRGAEHKMQVARKMASPSALKDRKST